MAKYFIEGSVPKEQDSNERSLQKINSLLYNTIDASGKIQVGGVTLEPLELNTTNALLTVISADLASTTNNPLTDTQLRATPIAVSSSSLETIATNTASIAGMAIPPNDFISLSYTGANLTGVVYKTGGAGGTTVATLTLAYSGSNLISVTKS